MSERKIHTYLRDIEGLQKAVIQDKEILFCQGHVDAKDFVKLCEAQGWSIFDFEVKHTWLDVAFDFEAGIFTLVESEDDTPQVFRVRITRFDLPNFN